MKKMLCLSLGCLCALALHAAPNDWLLRLQQAVEALGAYEVHFSLTTTDGYAAEGSCRVAGECYLIAMSDMRVFCDGTNRYEVNDRTREVVIDAVDGRSNNLLDNPVHAFDFVGEQYAAEQTAEQAERVTLRLTPRDKGAEATIDLTLDKRSALPVAVTYGAGAMQISLQIRAFKKSETLLPAFRKADFPEYEWIDFR